MRNWSGNLTYRARRLHEPRTVEELQELVAGSERIRALGTRHCFSPVADTEADLVAVAGLPVRVEVDPGSRTAVVSAGLRYGELAPLLHEQGWALGNLASLPHISVAGSVATATHGSGTGNRALSSAVAALETVRADGTLVRVDRSDPDFPGMVVALGALGVVVSLTLDVEPAYDVAQTAYDDVALDVALDRFHELHDSAYSVSLFTDWQRPLAVQVWRKDRLDAPVDEPGWLRAHRAAGPRHPLRGMPTDHATQQLGVPGPWHDRIPHFRLGFTPSAGEELQSEVLVAREDAPDALRALLPLADELAPLVQVTEVRSIAADDHWLSPAFERDSVGLHMTWVPDDAAVRPALARVEEALAPFAPRPHWGKISTLTPAERAGAFPAAGRFAGLVARVDPEGCFGNDVVDAVVGRERQPGPAAARG